MKAHIGEKNKSVATVTNHLQKKICLIMRSFERIFGDTQFHCSKCDKSFSQERNLNTYGHTHWKETRSVH